MSTMSDRLFNKINSGVQVGYSTFDHRAAFLVTPHKAIKTPLVKWNNRENWNLFFFISVYYLIIH